MGMLDTPTDRLACFCRSSTCRKGVRGNGRTSHRTARTTAHTLEVSWSTLSTTFPMDRRISVFCCLASVIKKEVTSVEPGDSRARPQRQVLARANSAPVSIGAREAHLCRGHFASGTPVQQAAALTEPQTGACRRKASKHSHNSTQTAVSRRLCARTLT